MSETPASHWRVENDDNAIRWLYFDKADAGTNVLSREVIDQLEELLQQAAKDQPRGLIITSAKDNGFIAGADVSEFTKLHDQAQAKAIIERGQAVMQRIDDLSIPTLALINGFCLGGGTELSLACDYRIALDDPKTKIGLPEVRLGIHPGFGGSVRLPPLIGAPSAMDLMLTGRAVSARAAKKMGLVDQAVPIRQLKTSAVAMIMQRPPAAKARGWKAWTNHTWIRPLLARMMRANVAKKAKRQHYPAPYALIDIWQKYGDKHNDMMNAEADSVANLIIGDTAQNLVRVFFLQEKLKTLGKSSEAGFNHVHVIGAGVMGGDIAAWCALRGMNVTLQDRGLEPLGRATARAYKLFSRKLRQPRLVSAAMDRLIPDMHGYGIKRADVIIEAIIENVEAKQNLFKELEQQAKPDALLATNTSSIPLETIAQSLQQAHRLVGLHFFNPVAQMQLVEIVHGEQTAEDVQQQAAAFTRKIDRLPLPVKSSPGFLVNRILMPYLLEAVILESEGIPAAVIDDAAVDFGMPMGPILLADTVGLDICLAVAEVLTRALGGEVPKRLRDLVQQGHLGAKSGKGFYNYQKGKALVPKSAGEGPVDLQDRLIYKLLNESTACLRESVVNDGDLLDAGVIFGTGFAPFRGGPMHYMQSVGKDSAAKRLAELEEKYGNRFHVDPGWTG